ncbi:hypothetical protein [Alloprevotella sp. oral taxon 473]|uniref:hypothetical protein n=1 Tax=Alloprevotella sp. oral taxon 473 TaxID=712469 RepID=UPI0002A3835C|nr:hypothetical protein [Alloprevotella sp. oral taxon 473]EKX93462.1 hypothetical protein HMPREF9999_00314 [Alloprevotella sp. oral taxon 473 str. F0040]
MITAFLLNILLLFSILWVAMGLIYTFHRWRNGYSTLHKVVPQADTQRDTPQAAEEHILVGKSKGLTTQIIAATSDVEATEKSSEELDNVITEKNEDSHEQTEESEIAVDYTLEEEVDEEEVLREEILWQDNATTDVSPTSILTRDLVRLNHWHKQDDSLDEEDETEVVHTLQSLKGTDLLAQYKAQLSQEERVHQKLLQAIDKAETEEQEGAEEEKEPSNSISEIATHPLDYYL